MYGEGKTNCNQGRGVILRIWVGVADKVKRENLLSYMLLWKENLSLIEFKTNKQKGNKTLSNCNEKEQWEDYYLAELKLEWKICVIYFSICKYL